jgi:hypothetical protein
VKAPESYDFPLHIVARPKDFKLAWFLIREFGVAAIPPSGKSMYGCSQINFSAYNVR